MINHYNYYKDNLKSYQKEHLKIILDSLPELPGIYKMLDSRGNIIYIGKSKCLKKRVKSYFYASPKWEKVKKMVSFIHDIEFIVTDTHLEARLLECELIKEYKPTFNSQMKNDRNYVYLKIEDYNRHNVLSLTDTREEYTYGPFRRKYALDTFITTLKNLYPIGRTNGIFDFDYHLFPVPMNDTLFEETRSNLIDIFQNDHSMTLFIHQLEDKMKEAASSYKFETASTYRDIISELQYLKNGIDGYKNLFSNNMLLKLPFLNGVKLFYVSKGQILLKETYPSLTKKELNSFIRKGSKLTPTISLTIDEKAEIDFRDILYSEIMSLPEEMVIPLT